MTERASTQYHERQNALTEADANIIKSIVESVLHSKLDNHVQANCRFLTIEPDDMGEAVKFYKSVNKILDESKSTARKTILVLFIGAVFAILGLGVVVKVKQISGQ